MVILEESVSRYHAEIKYINDQFYLKDLGSTTGTFIKISSQFKLKVGQILEMGSNQFKMLKISPSGKKLDIEMEIIEGPNEGQQFAFKLNQKNSKVTIGRKIENQISYPDDLHLSNLHGQLILLNNSVFFEEMSSTNGSWVRLSEEGIESELFELKEKSVFKIGTNSTYKVELKCMEQQKSQFQKSKSMNQLNFPQPITNKNKEISKNFKKKKECAICNNHEKDALLFPCRHNIACMQCAESLIVCPVCQITITDKLKIFQS